MRSTATDRRLPRRRWPLLGRPARAALGRVSKQISTSLGSSSASSSAFNSSSALEPRVDRDALASQLAHRSGLASASGTISAAPRGAGGSAATYHDSGRSSRLRKNGRATADDAHVELARAQRADELNSAVVFQPSHALSARAARRRVEGAVRLHQHQQPELLVADSDHAPGAAT